MTLLDIFKKYRPIQKGLYSGKFEVKGTIFKAHLRIENDGRGILSLNASRILHLNPTAAEIAYNFIKGLTEEDTITIMKKRYRVSKELLKNDVKNLYKIINTLGQTDKVCPLTDLGISLEEPFTKEMSAPLRMDIALTYQCQNRCSHCYNEEERKITPLEKEKWFDIIKRIESIGIPHIVFTGGEPTLVPFLPELIRYAENLGLVTGLNTNGRKLKDVTFARDLADSGLDHIQITPESCIEEVHNKIVNEKGAFEETILGIENALKFNIFTITNITITSINKETVLLMPDFIKKLGLSTVAVNSIIFSGKAIKSNSHLTKKELIPILRELSKKSRELELKSIWYTPTKYCELNPIEMGLGAKQCTAARLSMAVEPNGDVIPCQSYYKSIGNILENNWEIIWNNDLCKKLRTPQKPSPMCNQCLDLSLCGGGCPLENEFESFTCREILSQG